MWSQYFQICLRLALYQKEIPKLMCWWWLKIREERSEQSMNSWPWLLELDLVASDLNVLLVIYGLWSSISSLWMPMNSKNCTSFDNLMQVLHLNFDSILNLLCLCFNNQSYVMSVFYNINVRLKFNSPITTVTFF